MVLTIVGIILGIVALFAVVNIRDTDRDVYVDLLLVGLCSFGAITCLTVAGLDRLGTTNPLVVLGILGIEFVCIVPMFKKLCDRHKRNPAPITPPHGKRA